MIKENMLPKRQRTPSSPSILCVIEGARRQSGLCIKRVAKGHQKKSKIKHMTSPTSIDPIICQRISRYKTNQSSWVRRPSSFINRLPSTEILPIQIALTPLQMEYLNTFNHELISRITNTPTNSPVKDLKTAASARSLRSPEKYSKYYGNRESQTFRQRLYAVYSEILLLLTHRELLLKRLYQAPLPF
jgi:hypothetical protein